MKRNPLNIAFRNFCVTDGQTDGQTDLPTYRASYRDAWTHLKMINEKTGKGKDFRQLERKDINWKDIN